MSSTNRGARRDSQDFYPTPSWCVDRLLEEVDPPGGTWLEPAAGRGDIVAAVSEKRCDVRWKLIEAHRHDEDRAAYRRLGVLARDVHHRSFLDVAPSDLKERIDVVITNPPFSLAMEFVTHAMTFKPGVIAMLLRLNFLATEGRAPFMRRHAPDVFVLPNRPSFTGGRKTDSIEYAWFVWPGARRRKSGRVRVLDVTPRSER